MTEREAWEHIAKECVKPGFSRNGICFQLFRLTRLFKLSAFIEKRMHRKLAQFAPYAHPKCYRWPRTRAGHRARAAFCRKMARRLKK